MFPFCRTLYPRPARRLPVTCAPVSLCCPQRVLFGSYLPRLHRHSLVNQTEENTILPPYFPDRAKWHHPDTWVSVLQPDFDAYRARSRQDEPEDLERENETTESANTITVLADDPVSLDTKVSHIFRSARRHGQQNLLCFLGLEKEQWHMVSWIVRIITEKPPSRNDIDLIMGYSPLSLENRSNLPMSDDLSVEGLASAPIWLAQEQLPEVGTPNLTEESEIHARELRAKTESLARTFGRVPLDAEPFSTWIQKIAIGDILSQLGLMILHAATSSDVVKSQDTMTHVLDILAILHHHGVVPDFTYQSLPSALYTSRAPPAYFDDLFQPLLSSVLDAEWNIFQDSPDLATWTSGAQLKLPGYQFSSHNNPKQILPFVHEIWLELILWICLRGGWIRGGLEILTQITQIQHPIQWTAISWRDSVPASQNEPWRIPARTLSRELIASYTDALVDNSFRGLAQEGWDVATFEHLGVLKKLCDRSLVRNQIIDWNVVFAQVVGPSSLAEVRRRLEMMSDHVTKVIDYPRLLETSSQFGDFKSVRAILIALSHNKGSTIKENNSEDTESCQNTNVVKHERKADYISPDIIAHAVQCALEVGLEEPDLKDAVTNFIDIWVTKDLYTHPVLGPTLLQFANASPNISMFHEITQANMKTPNKYEEDNNFGLALIYCQIQRRLWNSMEMTVDEIQSAGGEWQLRIIIELAAEAMRMQSELLRLPSHSGSMELATVLQLLKGFLAGALHRKVTRSVEAVMGMLATVNPQWASFCTHIFKEAGIFARLKSKTLLLSVTLSPNVVAKLLNAVGDLGGLSAVQKVWSVWCQRLNKGIISSHQQLLASSSIEDIGNEDSSPRTYVEFPGVGKIAIMHKCKPNLSMIRILLRHGTSLFNEQPQLRMEVIGMLQAMGLSSAEIDEEFVRYDESSQSRNEQAVR
jgi:hypothetical protein